VFLIGSFQTTHVFENDNVTSKTLYTFQNENERQNFIGFFLSWNLIKNYVTIRNSGCQPLSTKRFIPYFLSF
jgi:hypothetical protein